MTCNDIRKYRWFREWVEPSVAVQKSLGCVSLRGKLAGLIHIIPHQVYLYPVLLSHLWIFLNTQGRKELSSFEEIITMAVCNENHRLALNTCFAHHSLCALFVTGCLFNLSLHNPWKYCRTHFSLCAESHLFSKCSYLTSVDRFWNHWWGSWEFSPRDFQVSQHIINSSLNLFKSAVQMGPVIIAVLPLYTVLGGGLK